jgi:5-methylcytosine-specific restriction endonuclease McrA
MPKGAKFIEYSNEELALLKDPMMTTRELAKLLNIGVATVVRTRKRLGFEVPLGAKKGKECPSKVRRETRVCAHPDCANTFTVVPSKVRLYCCHRCHSLTLDNSHLQSPEVLKKRTKDTTPAYKRYKGLVHRLSGYTYTENIDIINPNRYTRTLCGIEGGWQLDHIIPIKECYEKGMTPEEASSISNLRMLPWKENLMRNYDNPPEHNPA